MTWKKAAGALLGILSALGLGLLCPCAGLSVEANRALGVLACAIIWWVARVLPEFVTALLMAVGFMVWCGVGPQTVFAAFSGSTWWLLVAAFGLGLCMKESGLMARMASMVLRLFPRTFVAQSAGLIAAGTVIGPFIPSLAAKAVLLAPFSLGISDSMGYERKGRHATGLFLAMFTGLRTAAPAFLSGSILGYALMATLPAEVQAQFPMARWFVSALPWFLTVSIANYILLVLLFGRDAPDARGEAGLSAAGRTAGVGGQAGGEAAKGALSQVRGDVPGAKDSVAALAATVDGEASDVSGFGRWTFKEKAMAAIMAVTVVLWATEPFHGIGATPVALAAFVCCAAFGIFDVESFRSGVAWDSLIFIGVALGLAPVFSQLGIDEWVVALCSPAVEALAANDYAFVAGIGLITVALRFLIVSEAAYLNIFMAFMVPLSAGLGVNPWIIGFCAYALVNPWFVLYQNSIYLTAYYAVDGAMAEQSTAVRYCFAYTALCLVALVVSVPYWQWMGLMA